MLRKPAGYVSRAYAGARKVALATSRFKRKTKAKKALVKVVRKYVGSREVKTFGSALAAQNPWDGNSVITNLSSLIRVGNTSTTRVGNQVTLKSVHVRLSCDPNTPASFASSSVFRIILFVWKNPEGVAFTSTDLLVTNTPRSQRNPDNMKEFTILYDKSFGTKDFHRQQRRDNPVPPAALTYTDNWSGSKYISFAVKIPDSLSVMRYRADTGAETDMVKNSVFMYLLSSSGAANQSLNFSWTHQLRYLD